MIVDTAVLDADAYEGYKALAAPLVEAYGGTYRARGGDLDVREDDLWSPTRLVIVEFPDMATAQAFLDSEEYAPVVAIRHANSRCTTVIVDGV
jgi:uncharacterized protein (DUF1330 family)|tara:strand:- start:4080 stop:4358 length:279 start_codon:yes stop_codon:yes gene_type:complete